MIHLSTFITITNGHLMTTITTFIIIAISALLLLLPLLLPLLYYYYYYYRSRKIAALVRGCSDGDACIRNNNNNYITHTHIHIYICIASSPIRNEIHYSMLHYHKHTPSPPPHRCIHRCHPSFQKQSQFLIISSPLHPTPSSPITTANTCSSAGSSDGINVCANSCGGDCNSSSSGSGSGGGGGGDSSSVGTPPTTPSFPMEGAKSKEKEKAALTAMIKTKTISTH